MNEQITIFEAWEEYKKTQEAAQKEAESGRKYYPINEAMARRAHENMSFTDYNPGRKTAEYRAQVDEIYTLAEEVAQAVPNQAERIAALADRYARKLAENYNNDFAIGTRCPSVLIAGPANFPTRRKQKQVAAWERNMQEYNEIQKIKEKIRAIYHGRNIIKSGDADAVEKLEAKIEKLKKHQELMREANKAIRMKDTTKGNAALEKLGYTAEEIEKLRKPDFCGRIGYPSYELSNNNANIHRLEQRLESLKRVKEAGTTETEAEAGFTIRENTEIMRLQLIFPDKPEADTRAILKKNGFRWSPHENAWQRQLNNSARYALEAVQRELNA